MKTLLDAMFYFINPNVKLKNKIASGWLLLVACATLGGVVGSLIASVYGVHGLSGVVIFITGIAAAIFTVWAMTIWLNEG